MRKAFFCVVLVLGLEFAVSAGPAPPGNGERPDLTRTERILLALANSLSPDYQYGPEQLADIAGRPDFQIDEAAGAQGEGQGVYAYSFRSDIGGFAASGYFKISAASGAALVRGAGWEDAGRDAASGAEVSLRRVRRTQDAPFNEVEARLTKGGLVLTVSLRRPPEEAPAASRKAALALFVRLLDNARRYGLLFRIRIVLADQPNADIWPENGLLNSAGRPKDETVLSLRLEAVDDQGRSLTGVSRFVIHVMGRLAGFARIEGAVRKADGLYEVPDPGPNGAVIRLAYPALDDPKFSKALGEDQALRTGFGIVLNVDAELAKSAPGERP